MLRYLILFGILTIGTIVYAQTKWVELYSSNTFELDGSSDHDTLALPLHFDSKVLFKDVQIKDERLSYVRLNNKFQGKYLKGFQLQKDSKHQVIKLIVDTRAIRQGGTYEGLLLLTTKGRPEEKIVLNLVRPFATLDTLQTIKILIDGSDIKCNPFALKEKGNQSNVYLYLSGPIIPGFNADTLITFPAKEFTIKAGSVFQVPYGFKKELRGQIKLGKTKGRLEINSQELASPLIVPFEITRKRWDGLIFIFIFLGVTTGTFLRFYLTNRRDLEEKRLQGYKLIDIMERDLEIIKDRAFTGKVQGLITRLYQDLDDKIPFLTLNKDGLTILTGQIEATAKDYNEEKKTLEDGLKKIGEKVKSLSILFRASILSPLIRQYLMDAEKFHTASIHDLQRNDRTSAEDNHADSIRVINKFITEYVKNVDRQLADITTLATIPAAGSSDSVNSIIKSRGTKIKDNLSSAKEDNEIIQKLIESVITVDTVQKDFRNLLEYMKEEFNSSFIRSFKDNKTDLMEGFKNTYDQWLSKLMILKDDPIHEVPLLSFANSLNNIWTKVIEFLKKETVMGSSQLQQTVRGGILTGLQEKRAHPAENDQLIAFKFEIPDLKIRILQVSKNWMILSLLRSVFIFAVMALAAYRIYAPGFVGTFQELTGIFLFSFSLDVTVDNIVMLRDKKATY